MDVGLDFRILPVAAFDHEASHFLRPRGFVGATRSSFSVSSVGACTSAQSVIPRQQPFGLHSPMFRLASLVRMIWALDLQLLLQMRKLLIVWH